MTLSAAIKHRAPGRMRLQLVGPEFDTKEFQDAILSIRQSTSLRRVKSNTINHSILMEADDELQLQIALKEISLNGILSILPEKRSRPAESPALHFDRLRNQLDQVIVETTDGRLDFRTGAALLLMGLGLKQAMSAKFLPAGLSLIFYGIEMIEMSHNRVQKNQ